MITMPDLRAVDTNILIYLHDSSAPVKRRIAIDLLADTLAISSQVISEYLNTMWRLFQIPKEDLLIQARNLFSGCMILPTALTTLELSAKLCRNINCKFLIQLLPLLLWRQNVVYYIQKICIIILL